MGPSLTNINPQPPRRQTRESTAGALGALLAVLALLVTSPAFGAPAPCEVAPLPDALLASAASALDTSLSRETHSGWWRLGALLPGRVQLRRNDGVYLGFGEVLGTSGSSSERNSVARTAGWSVSLTWNLERLWQPPPPPPPVDRLARGERRLRLLQRMAALRTRHGQLRAEAKELGEADDPRCEALAAEAEALAWALCGALDLSSCRLRPSAQPAPPPSAAR